MATDDSQFIATGGEDEERNMGFFTDPSQDDDGAQMDYGVNVQGNLCGVYAESLGTPKLMADRRARVLQEEQFVGVYSIGQSYGVIAECFTGNGVTGISPHQFGAGVQGTSTNNQIGVLGLSMQTDGPTLNRLETGNGVGVQGVSGIGVGVRGVSRKEIDPDTPLDTTQEINVETVADYSSGIGVQGVSGSGFGVRGESTSGPGVSGHSETDRGGIFSSTNIAQVQLTPAPLLDAKTPSPLPTKGMAGDLFVRLIPDGRVQTPQGGVTRIKAELWFCVEPTEKSPGDPVIWQKVLLA